MAAINDVTGDELRSKPSSSLYETNYDNIFRKPKQSAGILILDDVEVTSDKPMESPSQKEPK